MPELPEVETVRRMIEPQIAGQTFFSVTVSQPQIIAFPDETAFACALTGQTVQSMSRRGKFLTIHMASGDRLVLHLRMTGELLVVPTGEPVEKHTHLIAALSGGLQLRYTDIRRFGRFWFLRRGEADTVTGQAALGPEPDDPALTAAYLRERLSGRRMPVKEALHDQSVVAGIGNIYSDEILFSSGLYPGTSCTALGREDFTRLAETIPRVIQWAIEKNTTTPEEYLAGRGREYRNTPYLRVYGRAGKPCTVCGSTLEKMTVAGRTSCYCPLCQRKPESKAK